ncbi:Polyphosphate:nucleotide phosphotransferase (PPK2) [Bifidobacterium magnum]|uniref:Polyphosphate:nucleotide phosphotransferase (PPK2) n=2 Tax=Bifidobacterium magnum TaxID=1692 RepID=A0A087BCX0_9BIFI|nr:Polyphosphate:nucleotide phosphotransferase (PPK2) [Bifidobacterium magnum]
MEFPANGATIGPMATDKDTKHGKQPNISKKLKKVEKHIARIDSMDDVVDRMTAAARVSEHLNAVFTQPPAQRLIFRKNETHLTDIDAGTTPGFHGTKEECQRFLDLSALEIERYQQLMYANGTRGAMRRVLIILQGMDASGKGGIVKHVFSQVNPMGIHYHGFGAPTEEDKQHDYLWRVRNELPKPGWIAIFDRSQYEDIVMPHVYGTLPEDVWMRRYDEINDFEQNLVASGCAVLKFYLVSSKQAQKEHFLGRLEDPRKFWKFDPSDLEARARWDDYMTAWQDVFEKTSTSWAPWYLIPSDHRWYSRMVVSELLRNTMMNFNMTWPSLDVNREEVIKKLEQ